MTMTTPYPRLALLLAALATVAACHGKRSCPGVSAPPAAPQKKAAVTANAADVVARVNGVPITKWDIKALSRRGGHGTPRGTGRDKRVLENIILRELARQQAKKLGLHNEAHLQASLQILEARSRAQERGILYEALLNREVTGKSAVTPAEARQYWEKNKAMVRTSTHVLQILRRDEPSILKALAALKAGKSFEEVAKNRPGLKGHTGSHKFWDLGFLRWVQIPSVWRQPLGKLKVGENSGVVRGPGNRFWILKVQARNEDTSGTFESHRAEVESALKREKLESRRRQVLDKLRTEARIEYTLDQGGQGDGP